MSRKHFIKLAAAIKTNIDAIKSMGHLTEDDRNIRLGTALLLADAVVEVCAEANPSFDRARFLTACGM